MQLCDVCYINWKSMIVAQDLRKDSGHPCHISIQNDRASRRTATKVLRASLAEFEACQEQYREVLDICVLVWCTPCQLPCSSVLLQAIRSEIQTLSSLQCWALLLLLGTDTAVVTPDGMVFSSPSLPFH